MQARKALTTLAWAYVVLCGPALARERMPSPTPSPPSIFPDTFVSVQLGMPQAELVRVRPAISANAFMGDNAGHAKLLFEKIRSEFIAQVICLFDESRPILVGVVYLKQQPAQSATRSLPAFRTAVLKKWGVPDSTKYGRAESGAREIALVWRRKDAVIVASYPAGDQTLNAWRYFGSDWATQLHCRNLRQPIGTYGERRTGEVDAGVKRAAEKCTSWRYLSMNCCPSRRYA